MRIASFNVESLDAGRKASVQLRNRLPVLQPILQRLSADVLCLQEINAQKSRGSATRSLLALQELIRGTQYEKFNLAPTTTSPAGLADVHNVVTLSRYPIVSQRQIHHDYIAPPLLSGLPSHLEPAKFDRPLLVTDLLLPTDTILTVVNLHLRAPLASPVPGEKSAPFAWRSVAGWAQGFYASVLKQVAQALEVRMLVEALLKENEHSLLLVAGDFNCEDHAPALRLIQAAAEDVGSGEIAAHALVVLDRYLPADRRWSVLHAGRPVMLDHILASQTLYGYFRNLEVFNETLADEAVGFGKSISSAGSYHAPLVAEFDLTDTQ